MSMKPLDAYYEHYELLPHVVVFECFREEGNGC